jgi:SAM-dependent methyltransferase
VDRVVDVRHGLPFKNVEVIYAEHFLEHLPLKDGLAFLRECRRVLHAGGVLRLSTPNLAWVLATHYRRDERLPPEEALIDALRTNKAFRGWGHQFLYNRGSLSLALAAAGFAEISFHAYGESPHPELVGVEGHEKSEDVPELPHVLIAQAWGRADPRPLPEAWLAEYFRDIGAR